MKQHLKPRQEGDEIACSHCGKRWDLDDIDPPQCEPAKPVKRSTGKKYKNWMRG